MKMSDAFKLPIANESVSKRLGAAWCIKGKCKYVTHAINNHDRMVDEIAELREALQLVIKVVKGDTEFACDEIDTYKIEQLLNK